MVTAVYSLFGSEEVDIELMNDAMLLGILIVIALSSITLYLCVKLFFKSGKSKSDIIVSISSAVAVSLAIVVYAPAMLNYFD